MGRVYTGLPEFLPGEAVVLNGGVEGVAAERIVIAPEGFGGIGFDACKEKVFIGVVMDPGGHIVKVAHEVVRNAGGPGRGGPVAVAEAGAQDEIQAPLGLLHQAQIEHLVLFAGSCAFKERLDHLAGLGGLLGSVSRVMPAAAEGDGLSQVVGQEILVAGAVLSGYREAAALAEEKVCDFPQAFLCQILGNGKGAAHLIPSLEIVIARGGEVGKIQHAEAASLVLLPVYRGGEYRLARFGIHQRKCIRFHGAHGGLAAPGPVTHGGGVDAGGWVLPAVLVLRALYLLQNDVPEDVFQAVSGAQVVTAAEDVKPQLGNGIPGHGLEFPDAVLPDPIFQVKYRSTLPGVFIGHGDLALILNGNIQVQHPGTPDMGPDLKAQTVEFFPAAQGKGKDHLGGAEVFIVAVGFCSAGPDGGTQGGCHGQCGTLPLQCGRPFGRGDNALAVPGPDALPVQDAFGRERGFQALLPVQGKGTVQIEAVLQLTEKLRVHNMAPFGFIGLALNLLPSYYENVFISSGQTI